MERYPVGAVLLVARPVFLTLLAEAFVAQLPQALGACLALGADAGQASQSAVAVKCQLTLAADSLDTSLSFPALRAVVARSAETGHATLSLGAILP